MSVCFVCEERERERAAHGGLAACHACWLRGCARGGACGVAWLAVCCVCACAYLLLGGVQRLCKVMVRLIDRAGGGGEAAELEVGVLLGAVVLWCRGRGGEGWRVRVEGGWRGWRGWRGWSGERVREGGEGVWCVRWRVRWPLPHTPGACARAAAASRCTPPPSRSRPSSRACPGARRPTTRPRGCSFGSRNEARAGGWSWLPRSGEAVVGEGEVGVWNELAGPSPTAKRCCGTDARAA